ncbi:MAG: squalene synthase HpnC [Deltaproteobacteria bacterium]|nr:squalene synthase HpnC [Deltaproteobacteria bacterium]
MIGRNLNPDLEEAFRSCAALAKSHYENFPIGWFVPKPLQKYVFAVYAFARTADDLSDEAIYAEGRAERLKVFAQQLDRAIDGHVQETDPPLFLAIAHTLEKTQVPPQLLKDLLVAFQQDVHKKRYKNFKELEDYCIYSANPIGRIVLHLFGFRHPELMEWSDKICTGIQLVNHWQDIAVDLAKDRVYLPEEDLKRFGYSYEDLIQQRVNEAFCSLMRFQVARTRTFFYEGRLLLNVLSRRLRWQVSLMWLGPMKILDRLEKNHYDIFRNRPSLSSRDKVKLLLSMPFQRRR